MVIRTRKTAAKDGKFHPEHEVEAVVECMVKRIGNGGMILSSKKYVGRKVYVLIRKKD